MSPENNSSYKKIALGIALLFMGLILVFGRPEKAIELVYVDSFASEPVDIQGFETEQSEEGQVPERIIIPKLSVNLPVKESKVVNGYWEVFSDTAGWGEGSGMPGKNGNQVIFAHAREGLFLPLKEVNKDMEIYVLTGDNWYGYKIKEIKEVYPNETQVIAPTENETLTLYTCSGFNDTKRLIVTAERI